MANRKSNREVVNIGLAKAIEIDKKPAAVARRVGVRPQHIYRWLYGDSPMSVKTCEMFHEHYPTIPMEEFRPEFLK